MSARNKLVTVGTLGAILILLVAGSGFFGTKIGSLGWNLTSLPAKMRIVGPNTGSGGGQVKVVTEESVTIDVVKKVSPAVVTVGITTTQPVINWGMGQDPFGFGFFSPQPVVQGTQQVKQDIGSGFIVKSDGLIITNKHVVSDTTAKYRVVTADNKSYDVLKIYRDPNNDLAILKIDPSAGAGHVLPTVELGDSGTLQVGQFAIAIGTALGEFRSTVTTGVVSGIGRSITAGDPGAYSGSEQLSNIIQTSAAINPGNSGGPLLNSSGQVIGVNVAVAQNAQNIGFALPINLVKSSLATFEANGQFPTKAYLGVEYRMISRQLSILNDIPEGAYVQTVVAGSPAEKAGVQQGDIITKIDGTAVTVGGGGLAALVDKKKPGEAVVLTVYDENNQTSQIKVTLGQAGQ